MARALLVLLTAASAAAAAAPAACTFIADQDYAQGSGGPNHPAASAADCCAQCVAAGPAACYAAVFDLATGGVCWFKTQAQTRAPVASPGLQACWPPGSAPPPPPPAPSPAPPLRYAVTQLSRASAPVIGYLAPPANSAWPQSFNPAFVAASPGTGGKRGLLVRSQNCTGWAPGACIQCNVNKDHPIAPWFPGSVLTFAEQRADGSFAPPYLVFAPEPGNPLETLGTEDPRLSFHPETGLYHLFYTCYGIGGRLCHATTRDPTAPYPGQWTRLGPVFGVGTKSGALLLRPSPPHYLYWGDSHIHLAVTQDLVTFNTTVDTFIAPRVGNFDDGLVEAGPSPQRLSDGNYIFFHNSASASNNAYHAEYVILNGTHPDAPYLERAQAPILSPLYDFELGVAPAECNVANVVFLEAVAPVDGQVDTFDVWFGGSDAVVSTARFRVTRNF